jgi:hypothetical protein
MFQVGYPLSYCFFTATLKAEFGKIFLEFSVVVRNFWNYQLRSCTVSELSDPNRGGSILDRNTF